ncbi:hypothetical protein RN001_006772 [Aquatica leii]|uniref:Mutator-like transposase domain-containing protein n=1 Tax=Aquatica leii TaxID=1421715 RepID=A0AAN7SQB8_9COLE|nr:hypothetical protein RN001_006772 [Aquatica leii]
MKETVETEKMFALEQGNVEHGLPYITVIVDGGWAKRSYGHGYTSNSENNTIKEHVCFKNYKGPATSMEQEIIVQGFIDCEERYNNDYGIDVATIDISEENLNIQKQKILDIIQEEANNRYTI